MKHRFLVAALASVMLVSGIGAVIAPSHSTQVQAISKYSHHWHWVALRQSANWFKNE